MGFLQRLFGLEKSETPAAPTATNPQPTQPDTPAERMGLNGEYDQSGLAKRVAAAFDYDPQVDDVGTIYVAQTGSTVVLKGSVPNQELLSRMTTIARGVKGATAVDTSQVKVG
ncbi:BON domain-containing protein [Candidatus Cyanaurora vandensis]|uniref:BON domain-containing protein n=1 Tax=Candidatus Cyanaurora vandensis TaxID=2714958 RepID=UPI00257DD58C|nr:BON domain-containing protein [Candidatus Cyanaurora vandensis]